MDKIEKSQASYLHKPNTQYQCCDCLGFIPELKMCALMMPADLILAIDSCNYFTLQQPGTFNVPIGALTKDEAGWARNPEGFSCKRCEEWATEDWDCSKVNKDSTGDDPGMIHPDGCCNLWKADTIRSQVPTDGFYEFRR